MFIVPQGTDDHNVLLSGHLFCETAHYFYQILNSHSYSLSLLAVLRAWGCGETCASLSKHTVTNGCLSLNGSTQLPVFDKRKQTLWTEISISVIWNRVDNAVILTILPRLRVYEWHLTSLLCSSAQHSPSSSLCISGPHEEDTEKHRW